MPVGKKAGGSPLAGREKQNRFLPVFFLSGGGAGRGRFIDAGRPRHTTAGYSRLTTSAGFWAATRQVWNVTVSNVTAATAAKAAANTHQATGVR